MTSVEKDKIELLWFVYGNWGKKHTIGNHKFLQNLLKGDDYRKLFRPRSELLKKVDAILKEVK